MDHSVRLYLIVSFSYIKIIELYVSRGLQILLQRGSKDRLYFTRT